MSGPEDRAPEAPLDEHDAKLIVLDGVSKSYVSGAGIVRALDRVNLTIARGEFVAIVGTSGSGKSTLMNILGCLDRPTEGSYTLQGFDVGARTNDGRAIVRNRLIGFIFQGFNLLPRTTALENCELPLQYRGYPAKDRRRRALQSLSQVGLADRVHHTPNQLSGGQQQRVAIARALVTDPPLLLADEPTGNLDTRTSLEVLALLQRLNRERRITIVLVTHEQDIAACASRVITVRDGNVVSDLLTRAPHDAEAALASLLASASPEPQAASPDAEGEAKESDGRRVRPPAKLPMAAYTGMALGIVGGGGLGLLYGLLVLGSRLGLPTEIATAVFGLLGAAYAGARLGGRANRDAAPLSADQRARLALGWSLGLGGASALSAGLFVQRLPRPLLERVDAFSPLDVAVALVAVPFALAALALLHYLLLTLFGAPRKAPKAGLGPRPEGA